MTNLKQILDNAPKISSIGINRVTDIVVDGDGLFWTLFDFDWWCWSPSENRWELDLNHKPDIRPIRSLSDIEKIVELQEEIEKLKLDIMHSQWTRTEVKSGEQVYYCNFCHRNLNYSEHDEYCVIKELNK